MREKEKSSEAQMTLLSPSSRSQLTFPYHILKRDNDKDMSQKPTITKLFRKQFDFSFINFSRLSLCSKVYAAEKEEVGNGSNGEEQQIKYSRSLDDLARAYIQQESGMDRIRMIFEKDHRGKTDLELNYIQVALVQVFVITFFGKYIPAAKFARKEFIRENQGTVFKTRFMAVRRLQDHTFMKAGAEAAAFSTKITLFSGSFLLLSSMISSYRNKTSVLEYALAAGITGGLARLNMGLRGFIAGSVVGGFLGSFVGLAGYLSLSAYGFTQEERHLDTIKAKLEVLKSIEGESSFRKRINEILVDDQASGVIQSS